MTIPAETLQRIRRIELRTRKLVRESFAGAYHSVFKGRGLAFDAVRPYQPGDDVRDIDWNVTARAGEPYIKRYAEERELTVMLVLDTSASCLYGTRVRQKRDLAAELGAVLALSATMNNDRIGLLMFSDQIESYIAPRKGRNHVLHIIRNLLAASPSDRGTDLALGLRTINRLASRHAIVFFMSDFLAAAEEYARDLTAVSRRHDLIAVVLTDPSEQVVPDLGLVAFRDAEVDEIRWVDSGSDVWRNRFAEQTRRFHGVRTETLRRASVDQILMPVDADYTRVLARFFQQRIRR
jgi:uncharacterized protein (DUF58 family)